MDVFLPSALRPPLSRFMTCLGLGLVRLCEVSFLAIDLETSFVKAYDLWTLMCVLCVHLVCVNLCSCFVFIYVYALCTFMPVLNVDHLVGELN